MENSDWTLYYSEEGYPYYFNAKTGESQWAEYDETAGVTSTPIEENRDESSEEEEDDEDDSEEDSDSDSDEESEEENEEARQTRIANKILEEKFKQFLRTPEGMAAMEAEQERLAKALNKKERKNSVEKEKEYVRTLQKSKKEDDVSRTAPAAPSLMSSVFSLVESTASLWTRSKPAEAAAASSSKSNKDKSKSQSSSATASNTTDDYGRQTVHRKPHSSSTTTTTVAFTPVGEDENIEAGARTSRSGSNSSLSSSDHGGSVSSDDSDIVTINAPFMSEFANYISLTSLHANYVAPVNNYLTQHHVYENTSSAMENCSATTVNVLSNVTTATISVTQQGLYWSGVGLLNAFSLLFTQINPLLLNFMNTVIDSNNPTGTTQGTPRLSNNSNNIESGEGGDSTPTKKSKAKSKTSGSESSRTPVSSRSSGGVPTPRAPSTPRTPRLPHGYSGGILPTPRMDSIVEASDGSVSAAAAVDGSAAGGAVTWKVYLDDNVTPVNDNSSNTNKNKLTAKSSDGEESVAAQTVDGENDEDEEEDANNASFLSHVTDKSFNMGEVYSAPPTPADGLQFQSNPIRSPESDGHVEERSFNMGEVYSAPPTPAEGLLFHTNPIKAPETIAKVARESVAGEDEEVVTANVEEEQPSVAADVVKSLAGEFDTEGEEEGGIDLKEIALEEDNSADQVVEDVREDVNKPDTEPVETPVENQVEVN